MDYDTLKALLHSAIRMIEEGHCSMTQEELASAIETLSSAIRPKDKLSKYQACNYLGISRAKFDNLVKDGILPKGHKEQGFKELFWYKEDLTYASNK